MGKGIVIGILIGMVVSYFIGYLYLKGIQTEAEAGQMQNNQSNG